MAKGFYGLVVQAGVAEARLEALDKLLARYKAAEISTQAKAHNTPLRHSDIYIN